MIIIWIGLFVAGGIGIAPWLMHEEAFRLSIAFWLFAGLVGFAGILSWVQQPKSPSDIFKN